MSKEALLIIDMLKDFVEEGSPLEVPTARAIIPRIRKRIKEAREKGMPVIYICDAHREDDEEFESWPKHAIMGTRGSEVVDELKPQEKDFMVRKRRYSGFLGTDLELLLRELKVEKLNIVGILTNICVFFTAAEAAMRGFKVTVYSDSVASLSEKENEFALDQLKRVLKVEVVE